MQDTEGKALRWPELLLLLLVTLASAGLALWLVDSGILQSFFDVLGSSLLTPIALPTHITVPLPTVTPVI